MGIRPANRLSQVKEYYFSAKLKQIRQLQADGKPIINLGIGSPDQSPDESVIVQLSEAANDPGNHGYQPYQGLPQLTKTITSFYKERYGVQFDGQSVLPLMGSKEGITHISLAYLNPGDKVLVPALGYPTYTSVTRMVEAEPIYYPLVEENNWEPDWDFLERANKAGIKLMWLNYPHMPTGAKGSLENFERFVDFARRNDILLCHDNPYSFVLNEKPLSIFSASGAEEVAIELNSLSKTFNMAGWRVGWMLGKRDLIDPVLQIKSNMDSGMFKPVQLAAAKALQLDNNWYVWLNEIYHRRRLIVYRILDTLGCSYQKDQAGMFVWAKAPNEHGESFSDELLKEKDIFITPGFIFGEAGKAFIRVSLCASEQSLEEVHQRVNS